MTDQSAFTTLLGPDHVFGANRIANLDPGIDENNLGCDLYVRPADAEEAAQVLKHCADNAIPVVTHGGRTGLAGGGRSRTGDIVLSTERMRDPIEIDAEERVALVGAGWTLQEVQDECAKHNLSPGIDIAARGSATIGGMISTNAGGMEAWRNGMMRDRLLGMEVTLTNGEVLSDLTRVKKANEGYDLKQIFCGAEGTLGVVTKAVLQLEALIPAGQTILTAQETAADAIRVMRAIQDRGLLQRAEVMWATFAKENAKCLGLPHLTDFHDAPLYVIYEIIGDDDTALEILAPFMEDGAIQNALMAQSERERDEIWRLREDSQTLQRDYKTRPESAAAIWFDMSVPLGKLDAYIADLQARLAKLDYVSTFHSLCHLGDGNLHMTVTGASFTDTQKTEVQMAVEHGVKAMGGAFSAEHGIGEDKRAMLMRCGNGAALGAMQALKAAFDPNGVLNVGKVV